MGAPVGTAHGRLSQRALRSYLIHLGKISEKEVAAIDQGSHLRTAACEESIIRDSLSLAAQLEEAAALLQPSQLRERFALLDRLDAALVGRDWPVDGREPSEQDAWRRLHLLRRRLEAMNEDLYSSIRAEIQQGTRPALLSELVQSNAIPAPGLSFDYLDELVAGILQLEDPDPPPAHPPDDMVFYQPTPARHIFHLLRLASLTGEDLLFDLGSGLGHVPLLIAIFTNAHAIGIDREEAYVRCARQCADGLRLDRVAFFSQDVRDADLSTGTVFYLYTPFTGSILASVLGSLQHESTARPIRVCTFGPCTDAVARESWLAPSAPPDPAQITIFHSRF
jgi:Methyltransferase domain